MYYGYLIDIFVYLNSNILSCTVGFNRHSAILSSRLRARSKEFLLDGNDVGVTIAAIRFRLQPVCSRRPAPSSLRVVSRCCCRAAPC